MNETDCFYFGCWNEAGHFLFAPGGRMVSWQESKKIDTYGPGHHLDGSLAPRLDRAGKIVWGGSAATVEEGVRIGHRSVEYPQGQFLRHVLPNGFTALSWWDRAQGDRRGACNSTILLRGERVTEEVLAAGRRHFPHVFINLEKAGIALVEVKVES